MAKRGLIFGLEDYLDLQVPNESSPEGDEIYDVTKEVDENGNPLPDKEQEDTRLEPDYSEPQFRARMGVEEYSREWKPPTGDMPYCPVYVAKKEDGGRFFSAYLQGPIEDVDDYIDLIDTLLTATEQDTFNIYIDSPGGLIAAGGIISSAIHHTKAEVFTIAKGICASAAALVHSSAKPGHCIVTPFAVMMYHMSSHGDCGFSTKIAERANNQVRYVNECLLNKALEDGHITKEQFDMIQNGEEIYVTASEFTSKLQPAE